MIRDRVPAAGGGLFPNRINNKDLYLTVHCPCQDDPDAEPNKTCRNGITKMLEADTSLDDLIQELMGRVCQHVTAVHGLNWEEAQQLVENFSNVTEHYWEADVEKRNWGNRSRSPVPPPRLPARSTAASSTTAATSTTAASSMTAPQPTACAGNLFLWTTIQGIPQVLNLGEMPLQTLRELGRAAYAEMQSRIRS